MERIEAVVFDWGGVLIDDPAPRLMAIAAVALKVSVADYTRVHHRHIEPFQRGKIDEETFWKRVCGDLDRPVPRVPSPWDLAFRGAYEPREGVFDLARRLHANGIKTAVLSNTERPAMEYFDWLGYEMFDAAVFSCAEGTTKPEGAIYEIAAQRLGVTPTRCVLLDDRRDFVRGAAKVGMNACVYGDLLGAKRQLEHLGVVLAAWRRFDPEAI